MNSAVAPATFRAGPDGRGAGSRPAGPAGTRPAGTKAQRPSALRPGDRALSMGRGFVTLFLEVEAGRRPRRQLARVMTPMLYARLTDAWLLPGPLGEIASIHLAGMQRDTCDLVAIVRRGPRCAAVALRLTRHPRKGWLVDDIARPECGPLPPPPYPVPAEDDDDDDEAAPLPAARHPQGNGAAAPDADWFSVAASGYS